MIKSMTGYGSAKGSVEGLEIGIELKSVNNKFLDTSVRLPRGFLFAEEAIKSAVQSHISRGKVDVFVNVESAGADDICVKVNNSLLKGYLDAINQISQDYSLPNELSAFAVSRLPDVLTIEKKELDAEAITAGISSIVEEALNRGHDVTAVVRSSNKSKAQKVIEKDLFDLTKEDLVNVITEAIKKSTRQENFLLNISHDLRGHLNVSI